MALYQINIVSLFKISVNFIVLLSVKIHYKLVVIMILYIWNVYWKIINVLIILAPIIVVISLIKLITNFVSNTRIVFILIRNAYRLVKFQIIFIVILYLNYNVLYKINNMLVPGQMENVMIIMVHLVHLLMDSIHLMYAINIKTVIMDTLRKD